MENQANLPLALALRTKLKKVWLNKWEKDLLGKKSLKESKR